MSRSSYRPIGYTEGEFKKFDQVEVKKIPDKITVFIKRVPHRSHMFFCVNCSAALFQYEGTLISLLPGDLNTDNSYPVVQFPVTLYCKHSSDKWGPCNAVYILEGFSV